MIIDLFLEKYGLKRIEALTEFVCNLESLDVIVLFIDFVHIMYLQFL